MMEFKIKPTTIVASYARSPKRIIDDNAGQSLRFGCHGSSGLRSGYALPPKDSRLRENDRERIYFENLAHAPWQARLIKLADTYDNVLDSSTSKIATKAFHGRAGSGPVGGYPRIGESEISGDGTHDGGLKQVGLNRSSERA